MDSVFGVSSEETDEEEEDIETTVFLRAERDY